MTLKFFVPVKEGSERDKSCICSKFLTQVAKIIIRHTFVKEDLLDCKIKLLQNYRSVENKCLKSSGRCKEVTDFRDLL